MAVLLGAAPAGAQDWSPATLLEPLAPGFEVGFTPIKLAANARGDAIAVWVRERHSDQGATCCDDQRVIASYRPAGGKFGRPETISRLGEEATAPDAAIDATGNAFVAWTVNDLNADLNITRGGVDAAIRRAWALRFGKPKRLITLPGREGVVVTAGAVGEAVIAWQKQTRLRHGLLYPRRVLAAVQKGPAAFAAPIPISAPTAMIDFGEGVRLTEDMQLRAAADRSGATYLGWIRADGTSGTCCRAVEVTRRTAGGAFEPPRVAARSTDAAPTTDLPAPTLASSSAGALVAWIERSQGECCRMLVSRDWPKGGPLRSSDSVSMPAPSYLWAVGVADDGAATALIGSGLADGQPLPFALSATRREPGGKFGYPEQLERAGTDGALVVDPAGSAHAIWTRYSKEHCDRSGCTLAGPRIDAGEAGSTGSFGTFRTVGRRDHPRWPAITASPGGALAGWLGSRGAWVAALGASVGPAPVARAIRGPAVTRFARRARHRFTFRLSKPARVLIQITRVDRGDFPLKLIGQTAVRTSRGPGRVTLPRRITRALRPGRYEASLIAEDATGHDSASIAPLHFQVTKR